VVREDRDIWGRGLRTDGPYPLPQTPTPNPLYFYLPEELVLEAPPFLGT
jgi:hypothetical protein